MNNVDFNKIFCFLKFLFYLVKFSISIYIFSKNQKKKMFKICILKWNCAQHFERNENSQKLNMQNSAQSAQKCSLAPQPWQIKDIISKWHIGKRIDSISMEIMVIENNRHCLQNCRLPSNCTLYTCNLPIKLPVKLSL